MVKYSLIMSSQNTVVILTRRPRYMEELVIHARANLSRPMPVLCSMYRLAFRPVLCGTYPLAAG